MGKKWLLVWFVVPALIGCSSTAANYLVDEPMILYPDATRAGTDLQARSLKALRKSLAENKWIILIGDKEKNVVRAEYCDLNCASVWATVRKDGSVEIRRNPNESLGKKGTAKLKRWLARLESSYEKNMR